LASFDDYSADAVSAYLVALIERPADGPHWANTEYRPTFERLLEKYGGSMTAAAPIEQVEGLPLDETGAAIFEFPSAAAARSFWNDPEYRAVVPMRQALGTFQIFILPGVDEEQWSPPAPNA
jgi:uncharacterized protein (DUF1330 family)